MKTVPHMNGKSCKPYMELSSLGSMNLFYTGKNDHLRTYKDRSDRRKPSYMLKDSRNGSHGSSHRSQNLSNTRVPQRIVEENKQNMPERKENPHVSLGLGALNKPQLNKTNTLSQSREKKVIFDLAPAEETEDDSEDIINIPQRVDQLVAGDILLKIKHKGNFSNSLVCRFCFNTAFAYDRKMKYTIKDVDPVSIRKNDKYDNSFAITLISEPFCKNCTSQTPIEDLCVSCKTNLDKEIRRWKKIHKIIESHTKNYSEVINYTAACKMHFCHSNYNDYEEILGKDDCFRKQSFRWSKAGCSLQQLIDNSDSEDSQGSGSEQDNHCEEEFANKIFDDNIEFEIDKYNEVCPDKEIESNDPHLLGEFYYPKELYKKNTLATFQDDPEQFCPLPKSEKVFRANKIDSKHLKVSSNTDENIRQIPCKEECADNFFDMIHEEYKKADKKPRNCIVKKKRINSGTISRLRPVSIPIDSRPCSNNPEESNRVSQFFYEEDFIGI